MKLEDQVCSLKLAKRLKELGVKQESLFYREETCGTIWRDEELMDAKGVLHDDDCVSAFTVAELFEITLKDSNVVWKFFKSKNGWMIYSASDEPGYCWPENEMFVAETVADALAKMLIHLIEKEIVKP